MKNVLGWIFCITLFLSLIIAILGMENAMFFQNLRLDHLLRNCIAVTFPIGALVGVGFLLMDVLE